ncbi:hypothetical protein L596_018494 [Steinernema carpocapsae]|uniref:Etoposide-induced protein 2.4 homolog n=1 Tax=Steinernema carpocapsae TaxID=34508 RepID=A0A4U5N5V0_STECR|nr:hypothetical protein L596_018494 [Steinernema carpocapsae]
MVSNELKSCARQFFRGLFDVFAGIFVLIFRIDEYEEKRQERLQQARSVAVSAPATPANRSILGDRMRKRRAAEASAFSAAEVERPSPPPKQELSGMSKFIFRKVPRTYDAFCVKGKYYLSPCRFRAFQCVLVSVLITLSFYLVNDGIGVVLEYVISRDSFMFSAVTVFARLFFELFRLLLTLSTCFWFSDLSNAAASYRECIGRPTKRFRHLDTASLMIADLLVCIITLFFMQCQVACLQLVPIPFFSQLLHVFGLSLFYAHYTFEYRYMNQGIVQSARVRRIEHNWPYYLGFGFPLALSTFLLSNSVLSGCIISASFPVLIVSSYLSEPDEETPGVLAIPFFKIPVLASEMLCERISKWCVTRIAGPAAFPPVQN